MHLHPKSHRHHVDSTSACNVGEREIISLAISTKAGARQMPHCQQDFPSFPRFPAEIRLAIWQHTLSTEPRLISLGIHNVRPLQPRFDLTIRRPQSKALYASYDSRQCQLRQSPPLFSQASRYPLVSANLSVDTIHIGPDFEMSQVQAFAWAIGPSKAAELRFLALEYHVKIVDNFRDSWKKPVQSTLEICDLFENLEKLVFIAHGDDNGSDKFKSRELRIMPWRSKSVQCCSEDDWAGDRLLPLGARETFAQWIWTFAVISVRAQNMNRQVKLKRLPTIEFMELVGVDA